VEEDRSARFAERLADPKEGLGQHVRTACLTSRNPHGPVGRSPPPHLIRALAAMTYLESLELKWLELTADLIRTLARLPALRRLTLTGCIPPKSAVIDSLPGVRLALSHLSINNVTEHSYLFEYLLPLLCSSHTSSISLLGTNPIPYFFLRTLGNHLPPHTLTHFDITCDALAALTEFFAKQHTLRELVLTYTAPSLPRIQLPEGVLPNLERFEGPDNPETYELLAEGRPLKAAVFRPLVGAAVTGGEERERLSRAFSGLAKASVPLEHLSLRVSALGEGLVDEVVSKFPRLRQLVVRSVGALSEELLREKIPHALRSLPHLQTLQLETTPQGPDSSSRPTASTIAFQAERVREFGRACKGLRGVVLDRVEWVRVGRDGEGDWRAYDLTPGAGEEGRWDVPVGSTVDLAIFEDGDDAAPS